MLTQAPIGSIDPDLYKVIELSPKSITLATCVGHMRSAENSDTPDKAGYDKTDTRRAHSNPDNDALGVAFEIGCAEALGLNPRDPSVMTLFQKKPYPPDMPDILNTYECRRLNDCNGRPTKGVTWYNKDITNTAYVLTGTVEHECDPVRKEIRITGKVTIFGWNYPLIDEQHTDRYLYRNGLVAGGTIKPFRMRPLDTLPLVQGARWA